jgi:cell division protein FtsX
MTVWFHTTVAWGLARRRSRATIRIVVASLLASLWCLLGAVWGTAMWRDTETMASQVAVEVHVRPGTADSAQRALYRSIAKRPEVEAIRWKTAESVWRQFAAEMGIEGAELRDLVDVPTVFQVRLVPAALHDAAGFAHAIKAYYQDVQDVPYAAEAASAVAARRRDLQIAGPIAGGLSILLFLVVVSYALRSEVNEARRDMHLGGLIGARPRFVAMPHAIVSWCAGALGLFLAWGIIVALYPVAVATVRWPGAVSVMEITIAASFLGIVGLIACWWQALRAASQAMRRSSHEAA